MSTLAAPLELWNVRDMEALVRKVIDDRLRGMGARLSSHDQEDLISFLLGQGWELSLRYDPAKDKNPNFGAYAARILSLRVADWYRQRFGDTRHGGRPVLLSLDAPATLEGGDEGAGGGRGRLVDALPALTGDPAEDRSPDLLGVLDGRGGPKPRPHDQVAQPANRAAPRGDRPAARAVRVRPRVPPTFKPSVETPVCEHCARVFLAAFKRANRKLPGAQRLPDSELQARARHRAQAVKFKKEWICPRCTMIPQPDGSLIAFARMFPDRESRRAAERADRKSHTRRTRPATLAAR